MEIFLIKKKIKMQTFRVHDYGIQCNDCFHSVDLIPAIAISLEPQALC